MSRQVIFMRADCWAKGKLMVRWRTFRENYRYYLRSPYDFLLASKASVTFYSLKVVTTTLLVPIFWISGDFNLRGTLICHYKNEKRTNYKVSPPYRPMYYVNISVISKALTVYGIQRIDMAELAEIGRKFGSITLAYLKCLFNITYSQSLVLGWKQLPTIIICSNKHLKLLLTQYVGR